MKFRTFLHLTLISKIFMISQLSDFVVCGSNLYLWSSGVYTNYKLQIFILIERSFKIIIIKSALQ